ncbi:MAG TPA: tetratricopeptide repeat protein [Bryobacteraceae bacterium]|nr:tetratricopeptide repeat protein [Bryobacteraceae bacterium]
MSDPNANSPGNAQPVVLIPISAEDFSRRRMRIGWTAAAVILVLVAIAGYVYKRYTDPLHARESFDAGTRLFKTARYNQANISLDRAIALRPDYVDAYLLRGRSYVELADPEKAIRDFSKVIELRPADQTGWIARGTAYLDLNNFQAAISDATQAIAVNQKEAAAYALRGSAFRKSGNARKAIEDFNRAVSLEPSTKNYFERGSTYQLLGEHQLAISDFDHVIDVIPDLASAFFARAESRRAIGDLTGAQQDHRQGRILDGH